MKFVYIGLFIIFSACIIKQESEYKLIGGPCEGCEAVFEYTSTPDDTDTLPEFSTSKKPLKLSGTVYRPDGKTPAQNVILYIHHTNQEGVYPTKGNEKGWGKRHGYLRGWVKTDDDGDYAFYTQIPGAYPTGTNPQHIHMTVLEPNGKYYYIEDLLFKDDPLLSKERINRQNPRGGKGFVLNPSKVMGSTTQIEI